MFWRAGGAVGKSLSCDAPQVNLNRLIRRVVIAFILLYNPSGYMSEPTLAVEPTASQPTLGRAAHWLALAALAIIGVSWLLNSPEGLLGKADAVGYAVCHRIELRTFFIGDIQMPLCSRCTGIYLGAVLGVALMALAGRARAGALPSLPIVGVLFLFIGIMGIDGINSYMKLLPFTKNIYEPQNWLRLTTGMFNGVAVAGLVYPMFNQTLWRRWEDKPVIKNFAELGGLSLAAAILIGLVLADIHWLLYALALVSSAGVLMLLTMTNAMIFMLATRSENRATTWREAVVPLAVGLTTALMLVLTIDVVRYAVTGTWGGFNIPGA